jgi:hypothetical protein
MRANNSVKINYNSNLRTETQCEGVVYYVYDILLGGCVVKWHMLGDNGHLLGTCTSYINGFTIGGISIYK